MYKICFVKWKYHQFIQASNGSDGDLFGRSFDINEKTTVIISHNKKRGEVYAFTLQGETWTYNKKVTASDSTSGDNFETSVAISGDTLLVGSWVKDIRKGDIYVFVLAGGGSWNEGMRLYPRNVIASGDYFGSAVALSGDTSLIGSYGSNEKGVSSGAA